MVVLVDWLRVFSIRWQHLALLAMVMVYDMNLVYFNKRLKMAFNVKNRMIGNGREGKALSDERQIISRLRYGNPWEVPRPEYQIPVNLYGRVIEQNGKPKWVDTKVVFLIRLNQYLLLTSSFRSLWQCRTIHQFQVSIIMSGNV